ncbi:hypothetical protein AB0D67_26710 [Streptosporangium sp. NPDC048047]|uniref:hypothetical protein n=1 Tax=Streptosporangium sp. NPDC048047 TaxID=3155748 RepID=UPI003445FA48
MGDDSKLRPTQEHSWLDAKWPGLEIRKDQTEHNPTKIKNCVKDLQDMLERLQGSEKGSFGTVSAKTNVMTLSAVAKDWPAGKILSDTLENGNREFVQVYQEIIQKLQAAILLLQSGATTYDGAGHANGGTKSV